MPAKGLFPALALSESAMHARTADGNDEFPKSSVRHYTEPRDQNE